MEPTQEEIDQEFNYLFWYYISRGYLRENAVRAAGREIMLALRDFARSESDPV